MAHLPRRLRCHRSSNRIQIPRRLSRPRSGPRSRPRSRSRVPRIRPRPRPHCRPRPLRRRLSRLRLRPLSRPLRRPLIRPLRRPRPRLRRRRPRPLRRRLRTVFARKPPVGPSTPRRICAHFLRAQNPEPHPHFRRDCRKRNLADCRERLAPAFELTVPQSNFALRLPQPWVWEVRVDRVHEHRDKRVLVSVNPPRPAQFTLSRAAVRNAMPPLRSVPSLSIPVRKLVQLAHCSPLSARDTHGRGSVVSPTAASQQRSLGLDAPPPVSLIRRAQLLGLAHSRRI
ncbi:MAG: hypothetical protein BWX70_03171 [Verrucomicrobia bacterium ADurb.Bin070]|nr:MAG: hypothetical protein BWX70_03171 [Verrucomicrobia bacterium ADurb.Bin070]